MHEAQCADYVGVGELAIEIRDLGSEQQALVNNGAGREGWYVKRSFILHRRFPDFGFSSLAHDVELALERSFVHA